MHGGSQLICVFVCYSGGCATSSQALYFKIFKTNCQCPPAWSSYHRITLLMLHGMYLCIRMLHFLTQNLHFIARSRKWTQSMIFFTEHLSFFFILDANDDEYYLTIWQDVTQCILQQQPFCLEIEGRQQKNEKNPSSFRGMWRGSWEVETSGPENRCFVARRKERHLSLVCLLSALQMEAAGFCVTVAPSGRNAWRHV